MDTLLAWTAAVFAAVNEGRRFPGHAAAELLNQGFLLEFADDGGSGSRTGKVDDGPGRRRRALIFCEMLAQLYGEAVGCRERGQAWLPRPVDQAPMVRRLVAGRCSASLLDDLERIERAKQDIDGNVNLGLLMAALCEDLSEHVRRDHTAASA